MAITNAQQYQQLVNKPAGNKRPGYAGADLGGNKGYQGGGRDKKGSVKGAAPGAGDSRRGDGPDDRGSPIQNYNTAVATGKNPLNIDMKGPPPLTDRDKRFYRENPFKKPFQFPSTIKLAQKGINRIMKKQLDKNRIDYFKKYGLYDEEEGIKDLSPRLQALADQNLLHTDEALKEIQKMGGTDGMQKFEDFMFEDKGSPGLKLAGNVGGLGTRSAVRDVDGNIIGYEFDEKRGDGDGMSDYERRLLALEQSMSPTTEPEVDPDSLEGMLANRVAYRFMADGGMTNDAPVEGGIMDLESGRQMYFLGKLVKKATRAVKKIVKSPIGKAALAFGAYKFGPGIGNFLKDKALNFGLYEAGKGLTGKGMLGLAGALTAAPLLFQEEEEEPDFLNNRGPGLDINAIRSNPYNTMGSSYRFYAEGGKAEPVAKETMPLIDMDGKEMDLRADGGFVPIGRMERADDVPARLSKNEFVFTADAVRNAGEGDIDKGAEVMYNMMKNLESGGEVSEESQGLDGAREMFQTSKRLEEVL
jgi:hypothetical protein